MTKINLLKTLILLITSILSYANVNAQCDKSDDFSTFPDLPSTANAWGGMAEILSEGAEIKTTTAGWTCENALVVQGGGTSGTATNRTKFKPMELGEKGIDLWGGLDYIGIVTSPLLNNGCSSISFNYASRNSNARRKLEISIKQNDNIVWRDTMDVVVPASSTKYTYTKEDVNIAGDFQLKIINLCPSNKSGSTTEEVIIWNICLSDYIPDTTPPADPTNLVVTAPTYSSIALTWTPSTDDKAVAGYNIYLSGDSIDTVTDTTYTVTGLTPETEYAVAVEAFDAAGNKSAKVSDTVTTPYGSYYASRVIEFMPAPGQFTNEVIAKSASGQNVLGNTGLMVSLGGFGGYIIVGFERPIVNHPQNPYGVDFSVEGNAFAANLYGVWTEPAAVRVMKDTNGNGIPDDGEWYELAGSDYYMGSTRKNVEMTYYNPHYNLRYTVPWRTNYGETGALLSNIYHSQSYYPDPFDFGCNKDSLTYTGNVIKSTLDMSTQSYIEFYRAPVFGYCDSRGNSADLTNPQNPYFRDEKGNAADGFDLSWAVDSDGNRVELDQIDFVKIYTAGNANAGWLGEWSSEVLAVGITKPDTTYTPADYYLNYIGITQLKVLKDDTCRFEGFLFKNGIPQEEGTQVWSTSDPAIGTVDQTGLFTAVGNGETWLRFSQRDDVQTDSIRLLVVELTGVVLEMEGNSAISSDSTALIAGETISITAQGLDNIGDVLNGNTSNRFAYDTYTWTTSNPEIGTINNGLFSGKQVGETMVYATSVSNPALKDSILVIVNPVPEVRLLADPVRIPYYEPTGMKKAAELMETGVNSTVYLNSVTSRNGRITPTIDKNALNYVITAGNYGADTLTFNITSFGVDSNIDVPFVYYADVHAAPKQLLYVDKTGSGENLKSYYPDSSTTKKLIDAANPAIRDVAVDGAFAFVAAEGYLSRYNITTCEQIHRTNFASATVDRLAIYKNLLLTAAHNTSEAYIAVYYKTDLTLAKQINLSGNVADIAVVNGKLYALIVTGQTSKMAIIDLATLSLEKEKSLYAEGVGVSNLVVRGSNIYGLRRHTDSAPAAVFRFETGSETYSSVTTGGIEPYFAGLPSLIEPPAGDSILLFNGNGFTAYNTATNSLQSGLLMNRSGLYPTGAVYDPAEQKYYATYSDAGGQNAEGQIFNAQFASAGSISGVEDSPGTLRFSAALTDNEAPQRSTAADPTATVYEKAESAANITINKNLFTDKEDDFVIYVRDISAHSSWLTVDTSYSTNGGIRLQAKYTEELNRDSSVAVIIEAIDSYGLSQTRTLTINLRPRIYPPFAANPLSDVEVEMNSADLQIPLEGVFTHTASTGVTFTLSVSDNTNTGLVNVTLANDTLTLSFMPNQTGEATVTLRGTAEHSTYGEKYAETSFKITTLVPPDTEAPSVPTNLQTVVAVTEITLTWTASTDNVGVTGYTVYLDNDSVSIVTDTAYTFTGLTAETEYTLGVEARDAAGNKSAKDSVTVTTFKTAIPDIAANRIIVYPNPFADYIIVNATAESVATIYDLSGRMVLSYKLGAGSNRIDASALQKGVYVLKLGQNTVKIVK